jgi:hypothetical protein
MEPRLRARLIAISVLTAGLAWAGLVAVLMIVGRNWVG